MIVKIAGDEISGRNTIADYLPVDLHPKPDGTIFQHFEINTRPANLSPAFAAGNLDRISNHA